MGTYTGTAGADFIFPGYVSPGVTSNPVGTTPGSASDTIYGNGGNDAIDAGGGDDWIYSGEGSDTVYGGEGNDHIYDYDNSWYSDSLYGGAGNDVIQSIGRGTGYLFGEDGSDTLYGGDSGDILNGGVGADAMYGGDGGDAYYVDDTGDFIGEYGQNSSYEYDRVYATVSYTLAANLEHLTLSGAENLSGSGNQLNNRIIGNDGRNALLGGGGHDTLQGGAGNDSLLGGSGNDQLEGGEGADTLVGGSGDDVYFLDFNDTIVEEANGGIDTIHAYSSFTLAANFENLTLNGGGVGTGNGSANYLVSAGRSAILYGLGGNDTLVGTGGDTLVGGAGDDYYIIYDDALIIESANGGTDTIEFHANEYYGDFYVLPDTVENLVVHDYQIYGYSHYYGPWYAYAYSDVTGNASANSIQGGEGDNRIFGIGGADTLYGASGWDTLDGGGGADRLDGGEDSDLLIGGAESDSLYGGNGRDTLDGGTGADWLDGGDGDDFLTGGAEADSLYGGHGYDTLDGGSGADWLDGGDDFDVLTGGAGADSLYGGNGNDTLDGGGGTDRLDGGAGFDTVLYTTNTTPVRVDLTVGQATFPGQSFPAESLFSIEAAETGTGNDIFIGNAEANLFRGNNGNDSAQGGGGSDTLYGGSGSDTLKGDGGADYLYGEAGNDVLDGGGATDYMDGGGGVDTVLYTANTTSVNINLANGSVSFPGTSFPSESFSSIENAHTGSAADTLTGSAVANELRGMAGADRLIGGGAADRLVGGLGNDTFVFAGGDSVPAGRDTLLGGDGAVAFERPGAQAGDRIDLSAIDANANMAGDQAFAFGTATGIGRLWVVNVGNQTVVRGNVNNNAAPEFELVIDDGAVTANQYTAADFIL